jgi:predicted nucleic acid-binding protein
MSSFFDTNVLVYVFDRAEPLKQIAAQDLVAVHMAARDLVISTQVLQELYVTLTRKKQLGAADALEVVTTFAQERIVPASAEMMLAALALSDKRQLSAWDALIVQAALQAGCTTLYSEDFQSGARFGELVVCNPFVLAAHEPAPPLLASRRTKRR